MWTQVKDPYDTDRPFVQHDRSLTLALNVDWLKPFKNAQYSSGAIYVVVNNLPRAKRFQPENTILVGVMPGRKEPETYDINNYFRPLVDELKQLYIGVGIPTYERPTGVTVRAALLNTACDIPAARKVNGFTSHSSAIAYLSVLEPLTDPKQLGGLLRFQR